MVQDRIIFAMNQLYTGINPGGILADLYLMRTYFIIKTNYLLIGSKFLYWEQIYI